MHKVSFETLQVYYNGPLSMGRSFPSKFSLVGTQLALIAFCTTSCLRGAFSDPVTVDRFNASLKYPLNCN